MASGLVTRSLFSLFSGSWFWSSLPGSVGWCHFSFGLFIVLFSGRYGFTFPHFFRRLSWHVGPFLGLCLPALSRVSGGLLTGTLVVFACPLLTASFGLLLLAFDGPSFASWSWVGSFCFLLLGVFCRWRSVLLPLPLGWGLADVA